MVPLLLMFRKLLRSRNKNEVIDDPMINMPVFDSKYKTIIKCRYTEEYLGMLDWVHQHSKGSVDVKVGLIRFGQGSKLDAYFGFEDSADAIIFKIKFSI